LRLSAVSTAGLVLRGGGAATCLPRHAPTKPAHVGWLSPACCEMALYCCRAACGVGALCVEGGGVLLCLAVSGEAWSWGLTSHVGASCRRGSGGL